MKRTAATLVMLAGLGGGCMTADKKEPEARPFGQASRGKEVPGVIGPMGEPVHVAAGQAPMGKDESGVKRADFKTAAGAKTSGIQQTAGFARVSSGVHLPGVGGCGAGGCADGSCGAGGGMGAGAYGPMAHRLGYLMGHGAGVLPAPAFGPPGAVAAVGAIGANGSGMYAGMYAGQRTSIRFVSPAGMTITWQGPGGSFTDSTPLQAPVVYNFPQSNIYRLKLSNIPNRPGARPLYPTLEVYPATPNTITYLSHASVPVAFTNEDFEQVRAGNLVIKVIYLPFEKFQDLAAVAGAEEIVSTRLEPGVNPIEEANRRGTILAVIRLGNIDLQDPNTPAMDAPPGGFVPVSPGGPPRMMPPLPKTDTVPPSAGFSPVPVPSIPAASATPARLPTTGVAAPSADKLPKLPSLK